MLAMENLLKKFWNRMRFHMFPVRKTLPTYIKLDWSEQFRRCLNRKYSRIIGKRKIWLLRFEELNKKWRISIRKMLHEMIERVKGKFRAIRWDKLYSILWVALSKWSRLLFLIKYSLALLDLKTTELWMQKIFFTKTSFITCKIGKCRHYSIAFFLRSIIRAQLRY